MADSTITRTVGEIAGSRALETGFITGGAALVGGLLVAGPIIVTTLNSSAAAAAAAQHPWLQAAYEGGAATITIVLAVAGQWYAAWRSAHNLAATSTAVEVTKTS